MADAPPGVSVVIVTRDRPVLLRDALRSVASQRLAPLEVRIADDGDHPIRADLVSMRPLDVTVLRAGARLPASARNRAASAARGEVLAFLDDDDRWLPDHLAGLADAFHDPATAFAWRDCAVIRERLDPDGGRHELARRAIARDWDPEMMREDDYLPPSAWGVRRTLFDRLGGFDETFRYSEDWDFVLRASACTTPRRVPGLTVEVRLREEGNLSRETGPGRLDCLRRLAERHGLPVPAPKTFWEVASAVEAAAARRPASARPGSP